MGAAIYSQLISIYDSSTDGLIIVRGKVIQHANRSICNLLNNDLNERLITEVLSDDFIARIKGRFEHETTTFFEDEVIAHIHFSVHATVLTNGIILIFHRISEGVDQRENLNIVGKKIKVLSQQIREPLTTIFAATEMITKKMPKSTYEEISKYLAMINQNCYDILKNSTAMSELSDEICLCTNTQFKNHDIVRLLSHMVTKISQSLVDVNIQIDFTSQLKELTIGYNELLLERAFYSIIAALLKDAKSGMKVKITLVKTDRQTLISFYGNGKIWENEYINYIYMKRKSFIEQDMQKYGYEMLRAKDIISIHDGNLFIEIPEGGGNLVTVAIPDAKLPSQGLDDLRSGDMPRTPFPIELVEMSNILPYTAYIIQRKKQEKDEGER